MHLERGKKSPFLYTAVLLKTEISKAKTSKPSSTPTSYKPLGTFITYYKARCRDPKVSTDLNG